MSRVSRGRRWLQWSIRSVLLLTMACAAAMGLFVSCYQREHRAIEWLEANHAQYSIELSGPSWLHGLIGASFFERVAVVQIDGSFSQDNVIRLTDEGFARLQALPRLRELRLCQALLTEEQFRRFRHFRSLRKLFVVQQEFPIKSIEELVDARPELDLNLAPAENLYHLSAFTYGSGETLAHLLIFAHYAAAEWKLECAGHKGAGARAAAFSQLAANLERVPAPAGPVPATENALLRCAIARAKLDLSRADGGHGDQATALEEVRRSTESMLALFRQAMAQDSLDVYDFDFAWQLASEPLPAGNRSAQNTDRAESLYMQKVDDYQELLQYIDRNHAEGGSAETCRRALAKFGLAMAKAELLEVRGEDAAANTMLAEARRLAADLRFAFRSAVGDMQVDSLTAAAFYERSYDADKVVGQAREDQKASLARTWELAAWFSELYADSRKYCYDTFSEPLLANLLATLRLRDQGQRAYEGTLEDLLKRDNIRYDLLISEEKPADDHLAPKSF